MKMDGFEINIFAMIIGATIFILSLVGNNYYTNIKYIENGYVQCTEKGLAYPIWKKECSDE